MREPDGLAPPYANTQKKEPTTMDLNPVTAISGLLSKLALVLGLSGAVGSGGGNQGGASRGHLTAQGGVPMAHVNWRRVKRNSYRGYKSSGINNGRYSVR